LFRLFVAETPFPSNLSSFIHDAETPPFSTLGFSSDTETPAISSSSSQFFDLSLLLQHPLSTDSKLLRFPTIVQTTDCDMIKKQPTKQHHLVGQTNQMVRQRYVNIMSNN
jgi:hypothetical protein